eukprot:scaffold417_cov151-Skeletonema_menzelii.AAC.7
MNWLASTLLSIICRVHMVLCAIISYSDDCDIALLEVGGKFEKSRWEDGHLQHFSISHVTRTMNVIFKLFRMMMLQCCDASIGNILTAGIIESLRLHYYTQLSTAIMRFTLSALAVVLLQLSSLPSQSDAFSPAAVLSSVVKTSSPPARKTDILYAQLNDDDGEKRLNESSTNKSGMVSSILLAGAALQFSTTKALATGSALSVAGTLLLSGTINEDANNVAPSSNFNEASASLSSSIILPDATQQTPPPSSFLSSQSNIFAAADTPNETNNAKDDEEEEQHRQQLIKELESESRLNLQMESDLKAKDAFISDMRKQLDRLKEVEKALEKSKVSEATLMKEQKALEASLRELKESLEKESSKNASLEKALKEKEGTITYVKEQLQATKASEAQLQKELQSSKASEAQLQKDEVALEKSVTSLKDDLATQVKSNTELEAKLGAVYDVIADVKSQLDEQLKAASFSK